MMIKIAHYAGNQNYFEVHVHGGIACTSKGISKILNLDTDLYNKLLVEKVIKHDYYTKSNYYNDYEFDLNNISEEVYIERFKEAFLNELTTLVLGGIN